MKNLVQYRFENGVSEIYIDDGKANVMSVEMLKALNEAFDKAESDGGVVLLAGREGIFSGGFDLAVFKTQGHQLLEMLTRGAQTIERMMSFQKPIVVACTGHAVAMGLFLLLASDYRIGVNKEIKISANEVAIGMTVPHFAIEICRFKLTPAVFNRAVTSAEYFGLQDTLVGGFIDSAVEPEKVLSAAKEKALSLTKLDMGAHLATKQRTRKFVIENMRKAVEADIKDWTARLI